VSCRRRNPRPQHRRPQPVHVRERWVAADQLRQAGEAADWKCDGAVKSARQERCLSARRAQRLKGLQDRPPAGAITYFAIVDPVIKGNDYNMRQILTEAFGVADTNTIYKTLADSVAGQQLVAMTLTLSMK
jgi:hypothetical protein